MAEPQSVRWVDSITALSAGARRIRFAIVLLMAAIAGCDTEWQTVVIKEGGATCQVVVYSPPYGKNARPADLMTIEWDRATLFDGILPENETSGDGMPVRLLEIHTDPGLHVLKVRSRGVSSVLEVDLRRGEMRGIRLFGTVDNQEVLIKDLGNDYLFR